MHMLSRALMVAMLSLSATGCRACRDETRDHARRKAALAAEDQSCGDVSSNPKHCGACAHDCLGAACVAGSCAPQVLAEGLSFPDEIAVDARFVYVLAERRIHRVPLDGGKLEELAPDLGEKTGLAVDDAAVYTHTAAEEHAALRAIPSAGGPSRVLAETNVYRLAVDATHVYVASGAGDDERIVVVPKSGGSPRVLVDKLGFAAEVNVDGADVVFLEYDKKRIGRVPAAGGAARYVATSETTIGAMAVAAGDVVWSDIVVRALLKGESAPSELKPVGGANSLALRDGYVYWGPQYKDGWIERARVEGGAVLKIAPSPHRVEAITTDARYVYWAERGAEGSDGRLLPASARILRAAR